MKRLSPFLSILAVLFFITCTKTHLDTATTASESSNANVNPNVPQCNPGYHWDYYLMKCVPDCPAGQHNDSITGACVVNNQILPPDQALTKQQFIDSSGYFHNAALNDCINNVDYDQSPSTLPSRLMTDINNYFRVHENGMILPLNEQLYAKSFASQLIANNFKLFNSYSIDSINKYYLNQIINSGINTQEASLLTEAKTIFKLSDSVYGSHIYDTVLNRANKILTEYNGVNWSSTNGDAIGGYLQMVIKSSTFWKNYTQGGGLYALRPSWWERWLGRATLPESDAAGYLVGWFKAWAVDDVPTANGRIKAGLWTAVVVSGIAPGD